MIGLNEETAGNTPAAPMTTAENRVSAGEPAANGAAASAPPAGQAPPPEAAAQGAASQAAGATPEGPSATDRAEQMVDNLAHRIGYLAAQGTRKLATFAARAREALQDFWAEVQDFRHGRKP
jgi:hypothetical protein